MSNKVVIEKPGGEIWCYGEIHWDSNFSVVCDNEVYDGIVPGLEDGSGEPVTTWQQVVDILARDYGFKEIEQIETC